MKLVKHWVFWYKRWWFLKEKWWFWQGDFDEAKGSILTSIWNQVKFLHWFSYILIQNGHGWYFCEKEGPLLDVFSKRVFWWSMFLFFTLISLAIWVCFEAFVHESKVFQKEEFDKSSIKKRLLNLVSKYVCFCKGKQDICKVKNQLYKYSISLRIWIGFETFVFEKQSVSKWRVCQRLVQRETLTSLIKIHVFL